MNIIRHLSKTVSPHILGDSPKVGEQALLKDFYAIFLAQLSEQSTYDTLTNYHKLPAKKISWYKFVHNIDWQENGAEKLLRSFAKAHNLDETDVYDLLKAVTPLTFFEVQAQADHNSIPVYLQSLLHSDNKSSFANDVPNWATNFLPDTLSDTIRTVQESIEQKEKKVDEVKASLKPITSNVIVSKANGRKEQSPMETTEISPQPSVTAMIEKALEEGPSHKDTELPTAVHAKVSSYQYTIPLTDEISMDAMTDTHSGSIGFMKNILPIIGLLIFAGLIWSMLRGCSSDLANQPKVEEAERVITNTKSNSQDEDIAILKTEGGKKIKQAIDSSHSSADTNSNTTDSNKINVMKVDEAKENTESELTTNTNSPQTRLFIEVDNDGNLLKAEIQAGSNALGFKLNKAISNIYDEVALRNSKMTIDEDLKTDMLTMDKVNDLLTLVKETPQGSMIINGKSVSMNALRKDDRVNLIHQAQTILPSIQVIDGKTGKPTVLEDKNSQHTVTAQFDESNVKADNSSTVDTPDTPPSNSSEANKLLSKPVPIKLTKPKAVLTDGELNIEATVSKSNNASIQAMDSFNIYTNLQTIIDALNMQVINFKINDNSIPNENKAILKKAASILKSRNAHIKIMGHTDSDGNPEYNGRLSQDRSYAVKKYLMSQGIPSSSIKADGAGEEKPIASNSSAGGKFRNRRIEFSLIKPE